MIKIDSTHFFTEYNTDKYKLLMPNSYITSNSGITYARLFQSNGVYIGSYCILDIPNFLLKIYDPENISSEEELDHLIERFLKLKAFL